MVDFKLNINNLPEKDKVLKYICDETDIKKVKKYIRNQGEKFISKLNSLSDLI